MHIQQELSSEMRAAFGTLTRDDVNFLIGELSIDYFLIANWQLIGKARIGRDGERFTPDPDGRAAYITPVLVHYPDTPESDDPRLAVRCGHIIDLVAWHPRFPTRWALRTGLATWLGSIPPQYMRPAPVCVWRTPVRWLQADCVGLVLLTHERVENFRLLSGCHAIEAEDRPHKRQLEHLLSHPFVTPEVRHVA